MKKQEEVSKKKQLKNHPKIAAMTKPIRKKELKLKELESKRKKLKTGLKSAKKALVKKSKEVLRKTKMANKKLAAKHALFWCFTAIINKNQSIGIFL